MKGVLTPEQQLRILGKIWGEGKRGYVFLPWVNGDAQTKVERRKSYHEGRAFKWPNEKPAILEHLQARQDDDLYFSVRRFRSKRRIEQNAAPSNILYADLDPVDPNSLGELKPTIAWASSPSSFQAVWIMPDEMENPSEPGGINHRLTSLIGADPSGWDTTQLLRVPGRKNFKFNYRDPGDIDGVKGQLLWDNGPRHVWEDMQDDLPEIGGIVTVNESVLIDEDAIDSIDRKEVWSRLRLDVSSRVRQFMAMKDSADLDRDTIEYEIARELADAGATALEIIALIRPTVWNKYAGRSDEFARLKSTAVKALAAKQDKPLEGADEEDEEKPNLTWLADIAAEPVPRPRWLVKDIWTRGGCGFISGAPKSYKSWMALDMAVTVASGGFFMNNPDYRVQKPGKVLYLQEEDSMATVMERLQIINEAKSPETYWHGQMRTEACDSDGVVYDGPVVVWDPPTNILPIAMQIKTGFISSDPNWQSWLDETLTATDFDIVLIDTMGTTQGDIDPNDSVQLMEKVLKPLKQLAQKHDTAVAIVHHNKKASNQGGRAGNDMLGSVALHAWVDCALYARSKDATGSVVEVERESKMSSDLKFKFKVPYMRADMKTGERVLWWPDFQVEDMTEISRPEEAHVEPRDTPDKPKKALDITYRLGQMKRRGGTSIEDLVETLGWEEDRVVKELTKAINIGEVEEVSQGFYRKA